MARIREASLLPGALPECGLAPHEMSNPKQLWVFSGYFGFLPQGIRADVSLRATYAVTFISEM